MRYFLPGAGLLLATYSPTVFRAAAAAFLLVTVVDDAKAVGFNFDGMAALLSCWC